MNPNSKIAACYTLRKGYKSAVVYNFDGPSRQITGVLTTTANKGMTKRERYDALKESLGYSKLEMPPYEERF